MAIRSTKAEYKRNEKKKGIIMDENFENRSKLLGKHAVEFLRDAREEGYDENELIDMAIAFAMSVITLVHVKAIKEDMSKEQKEEIAKINTHIAMMHYGEISEEELRKKGIDIKEIKRLLKSPEFKREKKTN